MSILNRILSKLVAAIKHAAASRNYHIIKRSGSAALDELLACHQEVYQYSPPLPWRQHRVSQVATINHISSLLQAYDINMVLDIGANKGQFANQVIKQGYQGQVISFEPSRDSFHDLMEASASSQQWLAYNFGLSDKNSEAELHIYRDNTFSSLYAPSNKGKNLFAEYLNETRTEAIDLRRLDDVWPSLNMSDSSRVFLKTDTQGHDYQVLAGASQSLSKISVIMAEASLQSIYNNEITFYKIIELLGRHGFAISGMYPFSFSPRLELVELDIFFINQSPSWSIQHK